MLVKIINRLRSHIVLVTLSRAVPTGYSPCLNLRAVIHSFTLIRDSEKAGVSDIDPPTAFIDEPGSMKLKKQVRPFVARTYRTFLRSRLLSSTSARCARDAGVAHVQGARCVEIAAPFRVSGNAARRRRAVTAFSRLKCGAIHLGLDMTP